MNDNNEDYPETGGMWNIRGAMIWLSSLIFIIWFVWGVPFLLFVGLIAGQICAWVFRDKLIVTITLLAFVLLPVSYLIAMTWHQYNTGNAVIKQDCWDFDRPEAKCFDSTYKIHKNSVNGSAFRAGIFSSPVARKFHNRLLKGLIRHLGPMENAYTGRYYARSEARSVLREHGQELDGPTAKDTGNLISSEVWKAVCVIFSNQAYFPPRDLRRIVGNGATDFSLNNTDCEEQSDRWSILFMVNDDNLAVFGRKNKRSRNPLDLVVLVDMETEIVVDIFFYGASDSDR